MCGLPLSAFAHQRGHEPAPFEVLTRFEEGMDCIPSTLTLQDILTIAATAVGGGAWLVAAVTLSRRRGYFSRAQQLLLRITALATAHRRLAIRDS